MNAEELLKSGKLNDCLAQLQEQVRNDPAKADLRAFLFQALALTGKWERALTQLNVAAEMDGQKLLVAEICRPALLCEALRTEVFSGRKTPVVFGQPEEWVGWMIQANQLTADKQHDAAARLREKALEAAPAVDGLIDGKPFEWLMDMDGRLGPILEAIISGRYYWVPFSRIRAIRIEPPGALRDLVWAQAQFIWTNGGQSPGLIPSRYVGSEFSGDDRVRLARKTEWIDQPGGLYTGLGQRMLCTNQGEYPLLEVRSISLNNPAEAAAGAADPGGMDASVNLSSSPPREAPNG
jgi:type VI secretion system protein ImpE